VKLMDTRRHSAKSSYREKLLEHLFVGDLLRHLWTKGIEDAEILSPEVDDGGYDLVIECNSVIRHIQLKSSFAGSKTSTQNLHLRLSEKPSGCVVWLMFDPETLKLGPFLWYGNLPGKPLPDISRLPVARHTKADTSGYKAERPNIRVITKRLFEHLETIDLLAERLFGVLKQ
jgi:hypothetical protein